MRIGDAPFLSPVGWGTGRVDIKAVDLAALARACSQALLKPR